MRLLWVVLLLSAPAFGASIADVVERNREALRLFQQARYPEAGRLFQEALSLLEAGPGANPVAIGRLLFNLACVYRNQGDLVKAEAFAERATALYDEHPEIAREERQRQSLVLASIYVDLRRWTDAERILRPMAEGMGDTAATALNSLAAVALPQGRFEDAAAFSGRAVERAGSNRVTAAVALNNLGQSCRFRGLFVEAEKYYREAIEEWEKALGPSHPDVARGLMNLAALYHERTRERGAEDLYRRAADILERTFGPGYVLAQVARNELADVLRAERRFAESDRVGAASLAAIEELVPAADPRLTRARENRARLEREQIARK